MDRPDFRTLPYDLGNELEDLKNYKKDLEKYVDFLENERTKQLAIQDVSPRLLFDNGLKYYKELAKASGQEINIDTASMIAKDYARHVNHFLSENVG